jgi:hypothetical protein
MLVEKNYYLHKSAKDAYRSYLMSYASHSHKDIFNVQEIDLQGYYYYFIFFIYFFLRHNKLKVAEDENKKIRKI